MKEQFDVYQDINERTKGDVYIGVVGPVRTGKSTFIKRFMETLILPNMEMSPEKERTIDELPQSGTGKTITTTEPKFIPKESVKVQVTEESQLNIRLVDCVGYMVEGAAGHMEGDEERLVKTPWFDYDIPFSKAAYIGTHKVITEHSTIGVVVITDGSIGEINRDAYSPAEQEVIGEMKSLGKPFVVLLNSIRPASPEVIDLANRLSMEYGVGILPMNCDQLKKNDILDILKAVLYEFPISCINFYIPKWAESLDRTHPIKKALVDYAKDMLVKVSTMKEIYEVTLPENDYIDRSFISNIELKNGNVDVELSIPENYYYELLSNLLGSTIDNEYDFFKLLKEYSEKRKEYDMIEGALESVQMKGYGLVMPNKEHIQIDEPELIKHGSKYGIKIKASAPSMHFIKANVSTEIAPIVGTKEQAEEFLANMKIQQKNAPETMWKINIFGKTVEQMVEEGLLAKSNKINDESQIRLQDTMEKIMNEGNGGMVFIII